MQDPYGRTINYLRLSITDRCNLRCLYCMPEEGIEKQAHDRILSNEDCIELVEMFADLGVEKVRLTGGEPLVRKGLSGLIKGIKAVEGIKEVSLTTNGILLEDQLESLVDAGIKRLNISLDTLNPQTYKDLSRGGDLSKVLRGIQKALDMGLEPLKINVVIIKGVNDHEIDDFLNAFDPSIEVRFIELMPIGQAAQWSQDKFLDLKALMDSRSDLMPVKGHGNGGPCRYYKHTRTGRYVGVINAISDHFCQSCNRIRVTSDGILKTCLHDPSEINLKPYLGQAQQLRALVLKAVANKPVAHKLNENKSRPIQRSMHTIGG